MEVEVAGVTENSAEQGYPADLGNTGILRATSASAWAAALLVACGGGTSMTGAEAVVFGASLPLGEAAPSNTLITQTVRPSELATPARAILAASSTTVDRFLAWVESVLPQYFPGPQPTRSGSSGTLSYVFRAYPLPNGAYNFIAISTDTKVYVLGDITAGALKQFGILADYNCTVDATSCESSNAAPANITEAARFLAQATLGANKADITVMQSTRYADWIDSQFRTPQSQSHYDWMTAQGYAVVANISSYAGMDHSIWRKLISSPDALRQRVTLALSEILVVSAAGVAVSWRQFVVASYLDILESNAFGNYRDLLGQMAMSPAMGVYLTYRGNQKANTVTGSQPDENFARELMQLFSIGLLLLNQDGTPKLVNGNTVETYGQDDVSGMARVWTGWDIDSTGYIGGYGPDSTKKPMIQIAGRYETGSKTFLGVTIPAGTSAADAAQIALDTVFNHPNTAPFVCKQLIQRLITSNPTAAYVSRVASAFVDDGSGVRGNLRAVIKAVFLDPEARDMALASDAAFGKLREPAVRFLNWARAFGANSATDAWAVGDLSDPATKLGQSPMRSASVFNFFRPGYVPPGSDLSGLGLVAPEFQITNESSIPGYVNFMQRAVSGVGIGDVRANYASLLAVVADSAALLAELNLVLAANQLPAATLASLKTALDTVAVNTDAGKLNRIYAAMVLVMASPSYIAQK